ncbi:MAG: molecular chaperone DnaK [Deltaproteobacteria bacterium]|nr:molecular chaperone DnaK [Deltaproteobacteria bacterium]MBU48066.1 molecular chaperone DnaK [Deltaproteobacteria bacterium]|tara:strand:+ start:27370 stop:28962 length:1593 start_codon:yes stop_codon:yes gene_type:complete
MGNIAIGIDLGTTNSCVALVEDGAPRVVPNLWGDRLHASVAFFGEDGQVIVGNEAKRQVILNPGRTIWSVKRIIGRKSFSAEVKKAQAICAYEIVEGPNHAVRIAIDGKLLSPEEISAYILYEMKKLASEYLGEEVTDAVVTVPAYFNDNQRQATQDAGRIAGLGVMRMINEPTAAALAYGYGRDLRQRVAIYDLGGGTFDLSILEIDGDIFEVLGTSGDSYLGGDDFDLRLLSHLADRFFNDYGVNIRNNKFNLQKLREACEEAKKLFSTHEEVLISIPDVFEDELGNMQLEYLVTREEFNSLVMDLVQKSFKVCDEALYAARCTVQDLDGVILVGGPTRLPIVREAVGYYFGRTPDTSLNPDEVVALGAAIHAAGLKQSSSHTSSTHAVPAHLLDVTPLSLQIATVGGYTERIIERNTPVPIERSKIFTTVRDGQERVHIRVYQGESNREEENVLLGEFIFSGFRLGYRGEVQIEVTFAIDANGLVHVTARDMETNKRQQITITLSSSLSEDEIQRIMVDNQDGLAPA